MPKNCHWRKARSGAKKMLLSAHKRMKIKLSPLDVKKKKKKPELAEENQKKNAFSFDMFDKIHSHSGLCLSMPYCIIIEPTDSYRAVSARNVFFYLLADGIRRKSQLKNILRISAWAFEYFSPETSASVYPVEPSRRLRALWCKCTDGHVNSETLKRINMRLNNSIPLFFCCCCFLKQYFQSVHINDFTSGTRRLNNGTDGH